MAREEVMERIAHARHDRTPQPHLTVDEWTQRVQRACQTMQDLEQHTHRLHGAVMMAEQHARTGTPRSGRETRRTDALLAHGAAMRSSCIAGCLLP